jgi:hypothetical protein
MSSEAHECPKCGAEPSARETPARTEQRRPPEGGTTIFVFGLLGIMVCGILGIIAWSMGSEYERKCRALGVKPDGLGVAGRIMGMVATFLILIPLAIFIIFLMIALLAGSLGAVH